jgi:MoxR-like ATPase
LDDRVTDTTQDGTYIVYSFQGDGRGMYVSLMQGVTKPQEEFKSRAAEELARRAEAMRGACASLVTDGFDVTGQTSLISDLRLAKLYEAATIAAKHYSAAAMPDDAQIEADLAALVKCYTRMVEMTDLLVRTPGQRSKIALIGTAREIANQAAQIRQQIDRNGAWAWWWSFAIREDALPRLTTPFHVYAYIGDRRLGARLRVDDFKTSRGLGGIESPWPDATDSDLVGKRSAGEKQSDVFKTWFKVGAIEMFNPPVQVDRFDLVPGLSTPENVLNQNSFGYVIDDETLTASPAQPALVAAEESSAFVTPLPAPLDLDWLIKRTGLSQGVLAEMIDSIMSTSPQIMLAGPPGTSKSWVARQLSLYLARERPGHVKFVQFHPGYSYEAFVEGLRPVTRSGAVSFELTPGTVKATVNAMSDAGLVGVDGQEFVIVMDEANRANLPRVLGELMFLFEYRGEPIDLQYSSAFSLPRNLRFIATMNTADRSIRSIDVALRRRFDVFELRPDAELLARFVEGSEVAQRLGLVDGFTSLNQELESTLDRHHTIGHAFFMRVGLDARGISQIWHRKIFPLIEEFFFDQPDLAKQFSIERFWPMVGNEL